MDWGYLYTSFEGRINRAKFWAGIVVLIVINLIINFVVTYVFSDGSGGFSTIAIIILVVVGLVLLYFSLALYAKRWHDREKSGWWSLAPFAIGIVGGLLVFASPSLMWVSWVASLIAAIWILVELGILPGTAGPNRYGPDPLG
jgi:uncharacterized membrane protein YhaH (DUF805 family)